MTEAKLAILKKKLTHPNDWDRAMVYFMDEFGSKAAFFKRSTRANIPIMKAMLAKICQDVFHKTPAVLVGLEIYKVIELGLVHGKCLADGSLIVFFYVTKMHKGVFAICSPSGRVKHCTRISALPLEELEDVELLYGDFGEDYKDPDSEEGGTSSGDLGFEKSNPN